MVHQNTLRPADHTGVDAQGVGLGGGCPQVQIHFEHRDVGGNGIAVRAYGEMKIASGERVWARELGLKTLQVLVLTPETGINSGIGYTAQKYVYHKGEFDNYASIDVYDDASNWISADSSRGGTFGPNDGSIWLDWVALGE